MTPPPDPGFPERLPPATRERVVEILTRHYAGDALSETELETRLERVYAATTAAELEAIVADLERPAAPPAPARPSPGATITALFSGQERTYGTVPRDLRVRARFGYVELDLTRATFEPGVTTIDVRAFAGYVQLRLPAGVRVESAGRGLFGFFALRQGRGAAGDARTVVRVTGRALFGFAECHIGSSGDRALPGAADA